MIKKLLISLVYIIPFISCTKDNYKISVGCEVMPNGTYMIKWETFPPMEGTVKIYESNQPDSFNLNSPIAEIDINQGYKRILPLAGGPGRPYFKLIFNKDHSIITTERVVPMQGIFNFRDIGGYTNNENRYSKWGRLYRSGSLAMASKRDIEVLNKLGVETVVDLRTERESYMFPTKFKAPHVYNLPLRGNRYDFFFDEILSQKMKRSDILMYDQNVFSFLLENNTDYFIRLFDILLEEKNYPIVMYCSLGKDRTAIATALIFAALEIDESILVDDYLMSNDLIDYHAIVRNADRYPLEVQETITALFSAHKETIRNSLESLLNNYGSIDNYFEKELKLTSRKREKLKDILLN